MTVVVNDGLLVSGEQVLEANIRNRTWTRTEGPTEDDKIGDVYSPHAKFWSSQIAKNGSSGGFECDFRTAVSHIGKT